VSLSPPHSGASYELRHSTYRAQTAHAHTKSLTHEILQHTVTGTDATVPRETRARTHRSRSRLPCERSPHSKGPTHARPAQLTVHGHGRAAAFERVTAVWAAICHHVRAIGYTCGSCASLTIERCIAHTLPRTTQAATHNSYLTRRSRYTPPLATRPPPWSRRDNQSPISQSHDLTSPPIWPTAPTSSARSRRSSRRQRTDSQTGRRPSLRRPTPPTRSCRTFWSAS